MSFVRPVPSLAVAALLAASCGAARADGVADLRAALARLQAHTPLKATLDIHAWRRTGDGADAQERQVVVDLGLDDGPGGLQAGYSRELRARLDAEARAAIRDRKAPHPISQALQEADVPRLQAMADAAPGLLLEIDQARFKEESADTVAGKPARKLVFERGVDSLSDHDRKYAKHFTSTLTVWIAPDGTPLAESRREDFSGRAFVVVSFEQHDGEERRFGLLGDRLVTLHDEEHALAQGAGEREESRTERQLQLQP